jgi:glycosyltransferase involved in cell wall biosynthesis
VHANTLSHYPVSVIICAKNEAEQLAINLPQVLSQVYPDQYDRSNYEVVVVNDGSTDETVAVLNSLKQKYPHLVVVNIDVSDSKGKKHALATGLQIAKHYILLMTDADCKPASNDWLRLMVAPLHSGKEIVAGYGGYYTKSGILNAFIRWETMHTYLQYSTYAASGMPYMVVGRNMACTRIVFEKAIKDPIWHALPSGDDDLLVQIAGTASNVAVVNNPDAFTHSAAKETLGEWVHQKQRHLSTGKYYKTSTQLVLGGYALSHSGMWIIVVCSLFFEPVLTVSVLIGVRCILYWVLWKRVLNRLNEKIPLYLLPLFDLGWMMYNFAFLPYITWKNKKNWK